MDDLTLPLFPLNTVLFPDGLLPLRIFEVRYLDMVRKCQAGGGEFGVVLLTGGREVRVPGATESLAGAGTMARITHCEAPMPGLLQLACTGAQRFRILSCAQQPNGLWRARTEPVGADLVIAVPDDLRDVANALEKLIASLQTVRGNAMPLAAPYRLDDCGWVANRWCELLPLEPGQKQRLLMESNPLIRIELVQDMLAEHGLLG